MNDRNGACCPKLLSPQKHKLCLDEYSLGGNDALMKIVVSTLAVCLQQESCLRLVDAAGAVLRSSRGTLWITQAGDAVDYVLQPGDSLALDRNGVSLACAVTDAMLRIEPAQPMRRHRSNSWSQALPLDYLGVPRRRSQANRDLNITFALG